MTNSGGCFPTAEQELLLRAALVRGDDAWVAWQEWQTYVDLAAIDPGAMRILPLVYLNLRAQGVTDPVMNRLKGVHRLMWYRNQILFRRAEPTLAALRNAGIRTMLLKGAALVQNYYRDIGARPMNDVDILVPPAQLAAAMPILAGCGWREKKSIPLYNSRTFLDAENHELDLHWHVLHECLHENADDDFWRCATPAHFGAVETFALNATDQLFHVCVHGIRWNPMPPLRWIADAMTILHVAGDEIDWARIIVQAKERQLVLVMRVALNYLREKMGAPISPEVLQQLNALAVPNIEEMDYAARTQPPAFLGLKLYWVGYQRLARANGLNHKFFGLFEYFQRVWDLEHEWQVPIFAVRRFARALRHA